MGGEPEPNVPAPQAGGYGAIPASPQANAGHRVGYAPPPMPDLSVPAQPQIIIQQAAPTREERYCGGISCLIAILLPCCCCVVPCCPCDVRQVPLLPATPRPLQLDDA